MMSDALATIQPHSGDNDDVPQLSLAFWVGDKPTEVDVVVHVLHEPTSRPASDALMTGLVALMMSKSGEFDAFLQQNFPKRPTEAEAVALVHTLMQTTNVRPH